MDAPPSIIFWWSIKKNNKFLRGTSSAAAAQSRVSENGGDEHTQIFEVGEKLPVDAGEDECGG